MGNRAHNAGPEQNDIRAKASRAAGFEPFLRRCARPDVFTLRSSQSFASCTVRQNYT